MRFKKGLTLLITGALVIGMTGSAMAAPPQWVQQKKENKMKAKFADMQQHWAAVDVERMSYKGYIEGFEDGSFRPKKPVTNEQALAMVVRAFYPDVEVDADSALPQIKRWRQISSPWALDVLAVAVEEGLTTAEEMFRFKPNKPAKRIDVARYISRVLANEDADVADLELDFIDMDKVDADDMAVLEMVVAAQIFRGNPDGSFQPNKPITRAEMAILLGRMDAEIENPADKSEVKGIVEGINVDDLEITVAVSGESTTYDIDEDAGIFLNNRRADLDDLAVGDEVLLLLNEDDDVKFIGAREVHEKSTIQGVVSSVYDGDEPWIKIEADDGNITKYMIDEDDVKIEIDGEDADLDELDKGDYVKVKVEDGVVVAIELEVEEVEYEGVIDEIDEDELVLDVEDDDEYTFEIDEDVAVEIDDEEADLDELEAGDYIQVKVEDGVVIAIEMELEEREYVGILDDIDADEIDLLVNDETYTFAVDEDTEIEIDGEEAELNDLEAGVEAEVEVEGDTVVKITVEYEEEELEGRYLRYDADDEEIVVLIGDEQETYPLADDVDIEINDDYGLEDLIAGTEIELTVKAREIIELDAEVEETDD